MQETRVASRYAKSLIDLAIEQGVVDQVYEDMSLFVRINEENRQFYNLLRNPIITHGKKAEILKKLFQTKVHRLTLSFFDIVVKKSREGILYEVARECKNIYRQYKGIQSAEIITTSPLTTAQKDDLIQMVKNISGKKTVELKETLDDSIIGGFLLKVGDKQVDQTVATKLNDLKKKFKDNSYIAKY